MQSPHWLEDETTDECDVSLDELEAIEGDDEMGDARKAGGSSTLE